MTRHVDGRNQTLLFLSFAIPIAIGFLGEPLRADEPSVAQRPAWTTSRVTGSPEPQLPYTSERAFPSLKFKMCVDLTTTPSVNRWFVVEQYGKILSFEKREDVSEADLVVDLAKAIPGVEQTYSLAFHPRFEENRYCYVCYIKAANLADGTHVARFKMLDTNPPTLDVSSEETILTWWSGGHNGCHLLFGPDGYLYVSAGDANAANPPDIFKTGQDLSDLPASILRIDIDQKDSDKNYRIPKDNPFTELAGARGEIWAYGLRNPWRMSFDRKTGDLWCGDVGWELWEMLHRIERGGNYGWSIMEAHQPINTSLKQGPTPILPPVTIHSHSESTSITEGLTYYGKRMNELQGIHIYSDYDTGKFWGIRYEDGKVRDRMELADTTHRVVGFGEDSDGEFCFLDHTAGTIHRLIKNVTAGESSNFPTKLSQTGIFASLADWNLAPGVVSYSINAEPWADTATSEHCVAIPENLSINSQKPQWTFPKNSVLVKSLILQTRPGDPASRRHIETQLLHFDGNDWMPYTYKWNQNQSDATLVGASGADMDIEIEVEPRKKRLQSWRFAGRAECQRCHNKYSGTVLGFNIPQLHREGTDSQLDRFWSIGLLASKVASGDRPSLADPKDSNAALDARSRAYLHVNCSHCHRMSAGGAVLSYMHFDLPLEKTNMLVPPTQGTFGIQNAKVIAPGDPFRSVLLYRMSKLGGGRMPRLGSIESDPDGIKLICDWISSIPPMDGEATVESVHLRTLNAKRIEQMRSSASVDSHRQLVQDLLGSMSGALALQHAIDDKSFNPTTSQLAIEAGSTHAETSIRELFERFLPDSERVKRLGSTVSPDTILAIQGDELRGNKLFFETASINCKSCHQVSGVGTELGPDLTHIGSKLTRSQMLESILEPSKQIDPKFQTQIIQTKDGNIVSGILAHKDDKEMIVRNAKNEKIRVPRDEIEREKLQNISMMPEQLVKDLTAQQLADMIAFLGTLKKDK